MKNMTVNHLEAMNSKNGEVKTVENNEEIRIEEYREACERLTDEITRAIARSLSHDEKVSVAIDASILDITDALTIIGNLVSEYDTARENNGSEDVWGTFEGDDFRLNIYTF